MGRKFETHIVGGKGRQTGDLNECESKCKRKKKWMGGLPQERKSESLSHSLLWNDSEKRPFLSRKHSVTLYMGCGILTAKESISVRRSRKIHGTQRTELTRNRIGSTFYNWSLAPENPQLLMAFGFALHNHTHPQNPKSQIPNPESQNPKSTTAIFLLFSCFSCG